MKNDKRVELLFSSNEMDAGIQFYFEVKSHPYFEDLRSLFGLEQFISNSSSEVDVILKVTNWVHTLWKHDGNNVPLKNDPISIIQEVLIGEKFRCVEYAIVASACLNALGIYARTVCLKKKDVETISSGAGHVVVEAFLNEIEKWVFIDPQFNIIISAGNKLLNTIELQRELSINENKLNIITETNFNSKEYFNWIYQYLYYFDIPFDVRLLSEELKYRVENKLKLMLVPLGEKLPKVFQNVHPIDYCYYTSNINNMYFNPKKTLFS